MSEAVSALSGASTKGFAEVRDAGLRGMISVRGDLSSAAMKKAVKAAAGVDVPGQREAKVEGEKGAVWMSPDELLVLVPYAEVTKAAGKIEKALAGDHHLVADVSDARAVFTVSGEDAREVLGKLTPADLHPDAFKPGMVRRTRLAQVPAAFWMRDKTSFEVVCFRSVARYVMGLLTHASRMGSEVDYY